MSKLASLLLFRSPPLLCGRCSAGCVTRESFSSPSYELGVCGFLTNKLTTLLPSRLFSLSLKHYLEKEMVTQHNPFSLPNNLYTLFSSPCIDYFFRHRFLESFELFFFQPLFSADAFEKVSNYRTLSAKKNQANHRQHPLIFLKRKVRPTAFSAVGHDSADVFTATFARNSFCSVRGNEDSRRR